MHSRGINSDLNVQKKKKKKEYFIYIYEKKEKKNYYSTIVTTKKESLIESTVAARDGKVYPKAMALNVETCFHAW